MVLQFGAWLEIFHNNDKRLNSNSSCWNYFRTPWQIVYIHHAVLGRGGESGQVGQHPQRHRQLPSRLQDHRGRAGLEVVRWRETANSDCQVRHIGRKHSNFDHVSLKQSLKLWAIKHVLNKVYILPTKLLIHCLYGTAKFHCIS